ncbi:MAG: type II secretion system protein GspG, partial [Magnetococcales bacterium]|nr:type II secretion system protein GspG [Magnetococcales bacterium]
YQYLQPGTHGGTFDLFTHGADGREGGTGINADIGNWNLDD